MHIRQYGRVSDKKNFHPADFRKQDYFVLALLELMEENFKRLREDVVTIHSGFDNYHKIVVRHHVRVPKFWRT